MLRSLRWRFCFGQVKRRNWTLVSAVATLTDSLYGASFELLTDAAKSVKIEVFLSLYLPAGE